LQTFENLGLSEELMKVLPELGFTTPTEIQQKSLPILLSEKTDFIGLAQTGTGKTAAFGLPLLEYIDPLNNQTQALVVAPTRELGQQIAQQLTAYSKYMDGLQIVCVYGGASITEQMRALKRPTQIVIATPGRLIDLMKRKALSLKDVSLVVLDEADEMLNMGFKEDVDTILSYTPKEKMTWLFSATMPDDIRRIIKQFMSNPKEVKVKSDQKVNINIDHQYMMMKSSDKLEALKRFLDLQPEMRGIVFCRTKIDTQKLADELIGHQYNAEPLHGDLSQGQRDRVMRNFKAHKLQLLIATDVAARGIDVNDVTHVIHFALPDDLDYYTHRAGRTARAGKKGISIALITKTEARKINSLEKGLKINFTQTMVPSWDDVKQQQIMNWADTILEVPADKAFEAEIQEKISEKFAHISKEDLISKILHFRLQKKSFTGSSSDLNEKAGSKGDRYESDRSERGGRRDRDRDKGRGRERNDRNDRGRDRDKPSFGRDKERSAPSRDRRERGDKPEFSRESKTKNENMLEFFINLGRMDGISKGDLVNFITDKARINHEDLGNISFQERFAFFEVSKKVSTKIADSFRDVEFEGRKLRVNRSNG
jgi:ATP-dependent RNA helicase DeaD